MLTISAQKHAFTFIYETKMWSREQLCSNFEDFFSVEPVYLGQGN